MEVIINRSHQKLECSLQRLEQKLNVLNSFMSGNKICFDEKIWNLIKEFLVGNKKIIFSDLSLAWDRKTLIGINDEYNLSENFNRKCKFKKISHENLESSINKIKLKIIIHSKWNMNKKIELPDDVWKIIKIFAGYQDVSNFEEMYNFENYEYDSLQFIAIDEACYIGTMFKSKHKFFILEKEKKLIIKYMFLNKLSSDEIKKILIYYFIKFYITLFDEYSSTKPLFIDFNYLL